MRVHVLGSLVCLMVTAAPSAQAIEDFRFDVETIGGRRLTESDFEANVLIVDLWGTWCPPCRRAVPVLEDLYRKYKQHGLEIVGFCYEGDRADAADAVRKFAAAQGVTYELALGTPAIQAQVPGFNAYPTMLYFTRGLTYAKTEVGFEPDHAAAIERWVRQALGLEAADAEPPATNEAADETVEETAESVAEPLPEGTVFKPGDGDKGFSLTAVDDQGGQFDFGALRGKKVLLAATSTWVGDAAETARVLQELHEAWSDKNVVVVAACLEIPRQTAARLDGIRAFRAEHSLTYRMIPAGSELQKKIHRFSGMPLFLVFDEHGTLIARETGHGTETRAVLNKALGGE